MEKENTSFAREKELAREYEKKIDARVKSIGALIRSNVPPSERDSYDAHNVTALFQKLFVPAFRSGKYEKPSEFFLAEMPWIFGSVVYERFRDAFLHTVDRVREYPYSTGWSRRSFRSDSYLHYAGFIGTVLKSFQHPNCVDADICDVLRGRLPEDVCCYLKTKADKTGVFSPAVIACELDRDNQDLEAIVTEIINGEGEFFSVSRDLIAGIVMSRNPRMHELLSRLLVAARLQEGLRQVICELADCGTVEAFTRILDTVLEHNLIRFSSVKRAVGTWIGIASRESRDLERVSSKSVELIRKCLTEDSFREKCLESEDAMAAVIALWSYGFRRIQDCIAVLNRISETGTHHQVLTAGYFVANLENPYLRQVFAREVLKSHRAHDDILAVYLPSLIPNPNGIAYCCMKDMPVAEWEQYFESRQQAAEFCDWLMDVYNSMKKKELEFNPCIFPWFSAKIKKSDLVEKAMVIAAMSGDQKRIGILCRHIADCEAFGRNLYFGMLTKGEKTPPVRKAIVDCLEDKSADTRRSAFEKANELDLTEGEYAQIEGMLRLRHDDLRRNAMALLMKQEDGALRESIGRLLASPKAPMRMAGLDMVTQLRKTGDRKALAESCMDGVLAISRPTAQEQILISALMPKPKAADTAPTFTEEDRYIPKIELGQYETECIRAFMEVFPDSKLETQIAVGKPVIHTAVTVPRTPCGTAEKAKRNLKSLSDFMIAHERDTYRDFMGQEQPIGSEVSHFFNWTDGVQSVPRMDLWKQWRDENGITAADLYAMTVLGSAQPGNCPYLVRCGKYACDLFGSGFEIPVTCRYDEHMQRIVFPLLCLTVSREQQDKIALAMGIWMAKCLPEDMVLGDNGDAMKHPSWQEPVMLYASAEDRANFYAHRRFGSIGGHFIAHPQFSVFIYQIEPRNTPGLRHRIPVLLNIYGRTYEASAAYLKSHGASMKGRITMLMNSVYSFCYRLQPPVKMDVSIYLYVRYYGLISDRTLYYHLMDPDNFLDALKLVTGVCAMEPKDGEMASSRTFRSHHGYGIRREYEAFIGKNLLPRTEQEKLVGLCHEIADRLVPVVVGAELLRGDSPAKYSAFVTGIHVLSGMETFLKILTALGSEPLDRRVYYYGSSHSRKGNLSHLLARCVPAPGDDAQKLGEGLKGSGITEKRLIEAALYSPAWIDIIGQYLKLPGFQSACYYFMAHMNEQFDAHKKAVIARFTPLKEEELNEGAFDVSWFRSAYEAMGEQTFDLIYDAAKYISDGIKHTRARKYADAALGRLDLAGTEAEIKEKRNKDLVMAYAIIPLAGEEDLVHRYLFLQQFLKESSKFGAQRSANEKKCVQTALRNLATNAGFSDTVRLTLRMESRLAEDNRELFEEKTFGEWSFRLMTDEAGMPVIRCGKDGKVLKSLPAKAKKDPYVMRLQDMKKQLTEQHRRTRRMFEQAMEDGTEFTLEELVNLCGSPVVRPIVSKLVFREGEKLGFFDGTALVDLKGNVLQTRPEAKLSVAHPLHLYRSGSWHSFQKHLFDNRMIQPFRQVFRELYVKTKDELGCLTSLRYAGNQIQPQKASACLKERRWVADIEMGLQKIYYQDNIVATIYALADWFTPADIEAPTLEHVAFYDRKTGQALKIDEIPDVIFSEVMRDVDLAVSVAHAGGVDPETSHSTVEMRAAILSFTLPLLRLNNVQLRGNHAFIEGKRASYSVHLGSGTVHQLGGVMLNVMPVHSQHRGRIFLPFVDEDPKTAEIISKVILFSEDQKLKDPTILEQISG